MALLIINIKIIQSIICYFIVSYQVMIKKL